MPIVERFHNPGSYTIRLAPDKAPTSSILSSIREMGHIVILAQRVLHPAEFADADLLAAARYAGPVLETEWADRTLSIRGAGMPWHLADADGIGPIIANLTVYSAATLTTVLGQTGSGGILPPAITAGNIVTTDVGTYTGEFGSAELCRTALDTVTTALGIHWRVNPNGKLDACAVTRDDVYRVTPTAVRIRRGQGTDPTYQVSSPEDMLTRRDGWGWASRSILVETAASGAETVVALANVAANPYYDIHGNALIRNVRVERPTSEDVSYAGYLTNRLTEYVAFDELEIGEETHLYHGEARVGDFIYVYDPPSGFVDTANEIHVRGQTIWPKKVRKVEDSWDIVPGMGVYYRPGGAAVTSADWIDLTRYVEWDAHEV